MKPTSLDSSSSVSVKKLFRSARSKIPAYQTRHAHRSPSRNLWASLDIVDSQSRSKPFEQMDGTDERIELL